MIALIFTAVSVLVILGAIWDLRMKQRRLA